MTKRVGREKRTYRITVFFSQPEYNAVVAAFKQTIYRKKSEYGRKLFLSKPVKVIYRNRSLDDLIEALNAVRRNEDLVLARPELSLADKTELRTHWQELKLLYHQIVDLCMQSSKSGKTSHESYTITSEK